MSDRRSKVGAIILARMDSRRLPGKVIADVQGKPLLWYVAARLGAAHLGLPVVLATSDRPVDDALADVAAGLGLSVYRGSADDVAGRLLAAARAHGLDAAFRTNGDSPFVEATLMAEALQRYEDSDADLITNIRPRSYPYGVSVELIRLSAFEACLARTNEALDREHVTRALYRMLPEQRIVSIVDPAAPLEGPQTRVRLTIDEEADLAAFRKFVSGRRDVWVNLSYREALASDLFAPA